MTIRFVIGPPGSGKTSWCLARMREQALADPLGPPLILLVPEQASYQSERALLAGGIEGTVRARVFSFSRLGSWVFAQSPVTALPRLNDVHRRVLVTAIIARLRREEESAGLLAVRSIERAVADMISEMKQFRVSAAEMEELAVFVAAAQPALARKLEQLARVAGEYDRLVRGRFEDPEDTLASLRRAIVELDALQGAQVFVDGFYGFTPVEREVLRGLVKRCTSVTFSLPMDAERFAALRAGARPAEHSRCFLAEETVPELLALAADEGVAVGETIVLPQAKGAWRFRSRGAQRLARHFLGPGRPPADGSKAAEIRLVTVPDERTEARCAVEQILAWRDAHGWRWSEMAIVTRSIDPYAQALEEHLRAASVPYFLDRHEPLETHPVVQGTLAALENVLGAWETGALLDFAKSGLYPFDRDGVAALETFLRTYPPHGRQWLSDTAWPEPPARSPFEEEGMGRRATHDMESIDATRRAIVAPLVRLRDACEAAKSDDGYSVPHFVEALCRFIADGIPEPDRAMEAILRQAGELLGSMAEAAGPERFPADVLLDLLRETFGRLTLPRIPPSLDQVLVAQIDRSRVQEVKGAVVLGLVEGRFPQVAGNATLLTDRERDELHRLTEKGAGRRTEFRASSRRMFLREGLFGWMAMTRASEALTFVRPLGDNAGQPVAPSTYWDEIQRIFPGNKPDMDEEALSLSRAARAREAAAAVCRDLFRTTGRDAVPPAGWDVPGLLDPLGEAQREEFRAIVRSAGRRNEARLDPALARELMGAPFRTSVSALESFASCPFQYFMRAMIGADVPDVPTMTYADVGNLAHAAMKALADRLIKEVRSYDALSDAEIPDYVSEALHKPLDRLRNYGLFVKESEKALARLLERQLVDLVFFLRHVATHLRARTLMTESRFGTRDGMKGVEFSVELPGGALEVKLRGQIDRIDLLQDEFGNKWLAVFDYKLSERGANWPEMADGKSLQLPVYLLVLEANREDIAPAGARLAGAFYIPVVWKNDKPRQIRGIMAHGAWRNLGLDDVAPKLMPGSGDADLVTHRNGDVISDAQFEALLRASRGSIERLVRRLAAGDIEVKPALVKTHTPCGFCDFRDACRLDYSMNVRRPVVALGRAETIETWLGPPGGAGTNNPQ